MIENPIMLVINGEKIPEGAIQSLFVGFHKDMPTTINIEYNVDVELKGENKNSLLIAEQSIQRGSPQDGSFMPRTFIGKEIVQLSINHIEALQELRAQRKVTILSAIPEYIVKPAEGVSYEAIPVSIETREYAVSTWDDMKKLIQVLVGSEVVHQKNYVALVQVGEPIGINSGESKLVRLSEKLTGYKLVQKSEK